MGYEVSVWMIGKDRHVSRGQLEAMAIEDIYNFLFHYCVLIIWNKEVNIYQLSLMTFGGFWLMENCTYFRKRHLLWDSVGELLNLRTIASVNWFTRFQDFV